MSFSLLTKLGLSRDEIRGFMSFRRSYIYSLSVLTFYNNIGALDVSQLHLCRYSTCTLAIFLLMKCNLTLLFTTT